MSAQRVGIEGGGVLPGLGLRQTDPERYGELRHPGDGFAFDIFTGIGRALRSVLHDRHGLPVEQVIATGASQSAFYLTTYINAIDPQEAVFDGFLLQGRAGTGAPIEGWDPTTINPASAPDATARRARLAGSDYIRDDVRVPVMVVQSETDVLGALGYLPARQVDAPTSVLSGLGQPGDLTDLFGTTRPLDPSTLASRYPGGRDTYIGELRDATRAAVSAHFLLKADTSEIEALGALSWPGNSSSHPLRDRAP